MVRGFSIIAATCIGVAPASTSDFTDRVEGTGEERRTGRRGGGRDFKNVHNWGGGVAGVGETEQWERKLGWEGKGEEGVMCEVKYLIYINESVGNGKNKGNRKKKFHP